MELKKLHEIAKYLQMDNIASLIDEVNIRSQQKNCELSLPLVGEFSSGKTTLINALTDSKKLETATKPTTATIYKLHFGCDHCHAKVLNKDGTIVEIQEIAELKNEKLGNAVIVDVFDTSQKVPSTTILVDTPGLSSPDHRHKQALVNYLPQADGILLVSDINQQLTRSLIDFVRTISLSKRPIFLVITKCDTKSDIELEQARKYIVDNIKFPIEQIVCVSAVKDNLQELFSLFDKIQTEKNTIVKNVDNERIKNIVKLLLQQIDELLKSSTSDKDLKDAIRQQELDLKQLNRNIDRLVNDVSIEVEEIGIKLTRQFEDLVSGKLETLVGGNCDNFDTEAISTINNTSSLLLNDYKNEIQAAFRRKAQERYGKENEVSLQSLTDIDLSTISVSGLNYNINLNALGHQYDNAIATATKIAVAAGAVYVGASALAAGEAIATVATADNLLDAADTATDVISMQSNNKVASRIESAISFMGKTTEKISNIDDYNRSAGQQMGADRGLVESMVGFVTDKTMGKPQRKRAIHNYMDETLMPEFKNEMKRINSIIIQSVNTLLHKEAEDKITKKKSALEQLKHEYENKLQEYEQRINQLRDFRNYLITI